ncbi:MAG: GFA family protein [Alphaproteobacteria bacterium]
MLTLTCHCKAVRLRLDVPDLPDGILNPRRCTCSICRRKGAVVSSVPVGQLHVEKGTDALRLYQFNTHVAEHWFCSICGIYTHHKRRSNPDEYGVNVGCIEGADPFALDVPVMDGVNHPKDRT